MVNKADNSLKLYDHSGVLLGRYPVATGLYKCTVEGVFRVTDKHVISRTGGGPLGTHWIGLNTKGRRGWKQVGIHGTNRPELIGRFVSNGCVRMRNEDIGHIYPLVTIGSRVEIVSMVVGPARAPAAAPKMIAQPVHPPVTVPVAESRDPGWETYLEWGRMALSVPLLGLLFWVLLCLRSKSRRRF